MGLGGDIEGILGLTGGAPKPGVPNANRTAKTFQALLTSYLNAQPQIFDAQNTYQPQYTDLDLSQLTKDLPSIEQLLSGSNFATAQGNTNTVTNLGADAASGWSNAYNTLNPNTGRMLDSLTSTATEGLAAGDRLTPSDLSSITNNVRSDWSSRGLGTSMPAAFNEALAEASGGQNLLNQRIGNASAVAGQNESVNNALLGPTSATLMQQSQAPPLTTGLVTGAGPTIVSPTQSSDFLNTGFNAQAASNISGANNTAALLGGFGNMD